jgi:hypothetical protein
MCMGFSGKVESPPPVQQSAPLVAPPASSPDTGLGQQDAMSNMRRRAMSAVGVGRNIATSPLGVGTQAVTTRSNANVGNLLG